MTEDGLYPFFYSFYECNFSWETQKWYQNFEIFGEGGSEAQKTVQNRIFERKKFLSKLPSSISRVFNGEIRGNCNSCSYRIIIFWHSMPLMSEMCLIKLKKAKIGYFWGFFEFFGSKNYFDEKYCNKHVQILCMSTKRGIWRRLGTVHLV